MSVSRRIQVNPSSWTAIVFALLILIGGILLSLPVSSAKGQPVAFIDALFTAASAVCVTGLSVVDTGTTFSLFGQIVIMLLIQLGGIGLMAYGVLIAVLLGKKIGLKSRILIQETTRSLSSKGLVRLVLGVILLSFSVELLSTLILMFHWADDLGWGKAFYYGLFHSVSAFNNAGFALWPDNLMRFVGDPVVNLTITSLIIIGGIGFTVIFNVLQQRRWKKLSLHTKVVLITTGILLLAGFLFIFFMELSNPRTFGKLDWSERLWGAYFQSVTPRTAGFNTLDIGAMTIGSQFFMIILMFIGASSGSTGGGIKTNTFAVLVLTVWSIIRGRKEVHLFHRRIPYDQLLFAIAVFLASLAVVLFMTILLLITEQGNYKSFLEVLFEATSAFGTVGLSMGLTPKLSVIGKLLISFTMYLGRIGPLTLAFALAQKSFTSHFRYAEEKVLIG